MAYGASQDIHAAVEFLQSIARDDRITMVAIRPEGGTPQARTFDRDDTFGLSDFIQRNNGKANLYFQVNPLHPGVKDRKATKADIAHAVQLHIDIDSLDGRQRLEAFEPKPTAVVCSGNGYHAYWHLDVPCLDTALIETLNAELVRRLGGDRGTGNVDRLLRVPFTMNMPSTKKRQQGRTAVEASVVKDLTDFSRRYCVDSLVEALMPANLMVPDSDQAVALVQPVPVALDAEGLPVGLDEDIRRLIINGPAIGSGGYKSRSEAIWRVCCVLARMRVPLDVTATLLTNPSFRISSSVLEKRNAAEHAKRQAERAWDAVHSKLQVSKNGQGPKPSLQNAITAVLQLGLHCWQDDFKGRRYVQGYAVRDFAGHITDDVELHVRHQILKQFNFDAGAQYVHDAIHALALENRINPMQEYFDGLEWDGIQRLDTLLVDYFGADDTPFNRSVGAKVLIAAVRRVRQPGTKFDTALILEGKQGSGKSRALRLLAGAENFADQGILAMDERAQMEQLRGILIYELCELEGLHRKDITNIKSFLSRSCDRGRPAYGRNCEEQLRTCVFVGTTNDSSYLRDATGNRRFWPVSTRQIDLQSLERDREQLWAEAAAREADDELIELEPSLYDAASQVQVERLEVDPWLDALASIKGINVGGESRIHTEQLFRTLEVPIYQQNSAVAKRLASVMRQLGWNGPKNIRIEDKVQKGFCRPP